MSMNGNDYIDIVALDESRTDGAGARTGRVSVLSQVLLGCVAGRPPVREMGLRLWLLCERLQPGSLGRTSRSMRKQLQRAESHAAEALQVVTGDATEEDLAKLVEMLLGSKKRRTVEDLGRRVMLMGYAFERSEMMRRVLPSFEVMGEMLGLKARNKRSAVCAAMKSTVQAMVRRGYLRDGEGTHLPPEIWFQKKAQTRRKYAAAQLGNTNREHAMPRAAAAGDEEERDAPCCVQAIRQAEHAERVQGIPVKLELARLSPAELRKHLEALHEAAERRQVEEWWQRSLRRKEGLSE